MQRREFLKDAAMTAAAVASTTQLHAANDRKLTTTALISKRPLGKTGEQLSIIGFGGIVVMDDSPSGSANIVAEAYDRGINYFDIAPSYGNAQERLGPALAPYRNQSFLACKTEGRKKDDSRKQLEESLRLLKTDHVDLYQFHALTKMTDLDTVLGPGGAMETMEAAKEEGKIRYIGFSVHSAETALAAMDRYPFDTILFPVNFVLFSQANFARRSSSERRKRTWASSLSKAWPRPPGLPDKKIIPSPMLVPASGVSRRSQPGPSLDPRSPHHGSHTARRRKVLPPRHGCSAELQASRTSRGTGSAPGSPRRRTHFSSR